MAGFRERDFMIMMKAGGKLAEAPLDITHGIVKA